MSVGDEVQTGTILPCQGCGVPHRHPGGILLVGCPRGHLHHYCQRCRQAAGYAKSGGAVCAEEVRAAMLLMGEGRP